MFGGILQAYHHTGIFPNTPSYCGILGPPHCGVLGTPYSHAANGLLCYVGREMSEMVDWIVAYNRAKICSHPTLIWMVYFPMLLICQVGRGLQKLLPELGDTKMCDVFKASAGVEGPM